MRNSVSYAQSQNITRLLQAGLEWLKRRSVEKTGEVSLMVECLVSWTFISLINSAKMSRALKITNKCCCIASSLHHLALHAYRQRKNDKHHALLCFSLTTQLSPKKIFFTSSPLHKLLWGLFSGWKKYFVSILGPGYLCDRYNVVKWGKLTLTLRIESDIIQKSSL